MLCLSSDTVAGLAALPSLQGAQMGTASSHAAWPVDTASPASAGVRTGVLSRPSWLLLQHKSLLARQQQRNCMLLAQRRVNKHNKD